jgi:hypothetical protein
VRVEGQKWRDLDDSERGEGCASLCRQTASDLDGASRLGVGDDWD